MKEFLLVGMIAVIGLFSLGSTFTVHTTKVAETMPIGTMAKMTLV